MPAALNAYVNEPALAARVAAGQHREAIGGLWEELGRLQLDFLRSQGMMPLHTLLDVGCGSGRLAVRAASYLDRGRYFGIDVSPALLDAARRELRDVDNHRINEHTFYSTGDFTPSSRMPRAFDYMIAQSVFTHLPIDHLALALKALKPWTKPETRFYVTFFTAEQNVAERTHDCLINGRPLISYAYQDPFHFTVDSVSNVAKALNWRMRWIGDWSHPRDQQMAEFAPA